MGQDAVTTDAMLAVVAGTATQDETDQVFAAALNDPDLRRRLALALPPDDEDNEIAEATQGGNSTPVKESHTRLLDMLAGWSQFIQREEGVPDAHSVIPTVCDLYQEVGGMGEMDDEAVVNFVVNRIIPVLLVR